MTKLRQWILATLAVIAIFFIVGIAADIATGALGYWHVLGAGFFAAMAVVVAAFVFAPSHRFTCASYAFAIGAAVAWYSLEPSWYPEDYGIRAYQPTHLPVLATYLGGAIGLTLSAIWWYWSRRKSQG
jgi:hypothetical protein